MVSRRVTWGGVGGCGGSASLQAGAGCPSFGTPVRAVCDWVLVCFTLQGLVECFTRTLLLDTAGSVLAAATSWDEIEIQEETEAGNSVTSKIRLPVQVQETSSQ